jgi:DNA replication protein DnaC
MSALLIQECCKQLRLGHIPQVYSTLNYESKEEFLLALLQTEIRARTSGKINRLIKKAGFSQQKTFENYEQGTSTTTFTDSLTLEELKDLVFMDRNENIMMLGSVGTGKTHLSIATGMEACKQGKHVRFYRVSDLVSILLEKHQNGTLTRFMREMRKVELLILDELGFIPFHKDGSELLFDLISECYETASIIITTNLEFGQWNTIFGDKRLTAAIIDRLVHHAHILSFTGESYRLTHALSKKKPQD